MKRLKGNSSKGVNAVKDHTGKAKYDLHQVLEVWRNHFDKLSTPKQCDNFNENHFQHVTRCVGEWFSESDNSYLLRIPFIECEVEEAISKLNNNKAPGYDRITSEHIRFVGPAPI